MAHKSWSKLNRIPYLLDSSYLLPCHLQKGLPASRSHFSFSESQVHVWLPQMGFPYRGNSQRTLPNHSRRRDSLSNLRLRTLHSSRLPFPPPFGPIRPMACESQNQQHLHLDMPLP